MCIIKEGHRRQELCGRRNLLYNPISVFLVFFLPVSAKSCIFAALIGAKTCR
jgi:hypothetical protein